MLERGEINLGQNLLRAVQPGDVRFASHPLEAVDLLAACHEPLPLDPGDDPAVANQQFASLRPRLRTGAAGVDADLLK